MPIPKKNRLLALEQTLHPFADKVPGGKSPRSKRRKRKSRPGPKAAQHRRRSRVEARAFDWDEPIELTYSGDTDSYIPSSTPYGMASSDQDEAASFQGEAFSLGDEDEAESFEVESFEWDEDEDSAASNTHSGKGSQAFSAADLNDEELAEDLDFSDLNAALGQDEPSRALSDSDFAADLQAILSGGKTYDRDRGGIVNAKCDRDDDNWAAAAQAEAEEAPPKPETEAHPHEMFSRISQHMPHNQMDASPLVQAKTQTTEAEAEARPHDVFDRMGRNMSYANSFDLGSISLEQRLDEFDELLNKEERTLSKAKSVQIEDGSNTEGVSASLALDEAALEADLALMQEAMTQEKEPETSKPERQKVAPEMHEAMAGKAEPESNHSMPAEEQQAHEIGSDEAHSD